MLGSGESSGRGGGPGNVEKQGKFPFLAFWRVLPLKAWAAIFGGWVVVVGLALIFRQMHFLIAWYLILVMVIVSAIQNRARIWREGDRILFRHPPQGGERIKSADSQIEAVIEWDGYEGILYDVIWKDGDVWTLPGGRGLSLAGLANTLKDFGLGEVPTRKDWRVYRPEREEKNGKPG